MGITTQFYQASTMSDMFGVYKEVSSKNVPEFQNLTKRRWFDFLRENPLLTSNEVTFTYNNGFIKEKWTRGMLIRIFKVMAFVLMILAYIIWYIIRIVASCVGFICNIADIPANLLFRALLFITNMLDNFTVPISEEDYEYLLDNPIPFKGLEGEDVVMTAKKDGAMLTLVDVDAFGNEIVTERIFTDEGMEQTTYLKRGGIKAVRMFEKISQ